MIWYVAETTELAAEPGTWAMASIVPLCVTSIELPAAVPPPR